MSKPVKHIANGRKFPKTSDELHQFIADSLRDLIAIPANAHSISVAVLHSQLRALTDSRELQARAQLEVVLVKTEYAGSIRASIEAPAVEGELLSVKLEERPNGPDSEWVDLEGQGYSAEQIDKLVKLVLSQTAVPGEVFYITTNQAVDQTRQAVSDMMFEQAKKVAEFDLPADTTGDPAAGVTEAQSAEKVTLN